MAEAGTRIRERMRWTLKRLLVLLVVSVSSGDS